jgi:hypothetical protein
MNEAVARSEQWRHGWGHVKLGSSGEVARCRGKKMKRGACSTEEKVEPSGSVMGASLKGS